MSDTFEAMETSSLLFFISYLKLKYLIYLGHNVYKMVLPMIIGQFALRNTHLMALTWQENVFFLNLATKV